MIPSMTRKVAISVPDDLLSAVDSQSRMEGISRSGLFAEAARTYIAEQEQRRLREAYVSSYQQHPESDDEIAATDAFLQRSFSNSK